VYSRRRSVLGLVNYVRTGATATLLGTVSLSTGVCFNTIHYVNKSSESKLGRAASPPVTTENALVRCVC